MAEKAETSSPPPSLKCPLCWDIFVEAAVLPTCGHTFCRKCIKKCEQIHPNQNDMSCPVCRNLAKFTSEKRSDAFPANVTVNGFVDDYHARIGETRPKCTACKRQGDAYLCEMCVTSDFVPKSDVNGKENGRKRKPADSFRPDHRSISRTYPKLEFIRCAYLRGWISGSTRFSEKSVAISYEGTSCGIDIIDSSGRKHQYNRIRSDLRCCDVVFMTDRSVCISTGFTEAHMYSPNGSKKSTIHVKNNGKCLTLDRSPSDEIIITNAGKQVYIYDPTGSTLKHTVQTSHRTGQASATRSGLIITSSCWHDPSMVTVYDRDGNAGESLQAPKGVRLYATVDEQDRVYVASVEKKNGKVRIGLYDLDGRSLKKRVELKKTLKLISGSHRCYLVSLSRGMLALACTSKLYFIKVSL